MNIGIMAGTVFGLDGEIWIVKSFKDARTAITRSMTTQREVETLVSKITDILPAVGGRGLPVEMFVHEKDVSTDEWREFKRVSDALSPLLNKPDRKVAEVKTVAATLGFSLAKTYELLKKLETSDRLTLLKRKRRSDIGRRRLSKPIIEALDHVIAKHWLHGQRKSFAAVYEELGKHFRKKKLRPPNIDTMVSRIRELPKYDSTKVREGTVRALPHRLGRGSVEAGYPYAEIQIDHTLVDIELVDSEHGKPIGRPWITVAIDVFSRMTVGWYVSFDPPGSLSTGITIANAILPKGPQMVQMGVDYEWICQGLPVIVRADNAGEFRGTMLGMACGNLKFEMKFRKVLQPQYGAHIERYQGTLMKWIHALPGTTWSNPKEKGDYKVKPVITLEQFEKALAHLILGKYHHRGHSELDDRAPVNVMRDAILGSDEMPGIGTSPTPPDEERLRLDLLPPEFRTIQSDGVEIDKIGYSHAVLAPWIGAREPGNVKKARRFIFRRDPRNIGQIFFFDPRTEIYYRIPYADKTRRPISLWRLRAVRRWLTERRVADQDVNESVIFKALEEMDKIVDEAFRAGKATRSMLRNKERARGHAKGSARPRPGGGLVGNEVPSASDDSDDDPSSFV